MSNNVWNTINILKVEILDVMIVRGLQGQDMHQWVCLLSNHVFYYVSNNVSNRIDVLKSKYLHEILEVEIVRGQQVQGKCQ